MASDSLKAVPKNPAPRTTLSNGVHIGEGGSGSPVLGLGTADWQAKPEETQLAVHSALDAGYRHIDTAAVYGNEEHIGAALKSYLDSGKADGLRREDLFIVTKLWCDHNREAAVEPALRESLGRLQLDYVDLYLVHMPVPHYVSYDYAVLTANKTWAYNYRVFSEFLAQS